MSWDRMLWGIWFTSNRTDPGFLIGAAWDAEKRKQQYDNDEVSRALLFTTRRKAATWCKQEYEKWSQNSTMRLWRVRPVRVRETVEVIRK